MENEAILRKLRALLAKAEGTVGPESEAFMGKLRELLQKHQLEMHDLEGESDPLVQHNHGFTVNHPWQMVVCSVGAEFLGCAAVFQHVGGGINTCQLFGRQSACVTAHHMLRYWVMEVVRLAKLHHLSQEHVGTGLTFRLQKVIEKTGPAPSNGTDMIPISAALALVTAEGAMNEEISTEITDEGNRVAEGISLNLQATSDREEHRRIK